MNKSSNKYQGKINRFKDNAFKYLGISASLIGIFLLTIFIGNILIDGLSRIDLDFLTSLPSRKAEKAGILTAWSGSLWIITFTFIIAVPLGVCAGIYLQEYGKKNFLNTILRD